MSSAEEERKLFWYLCGNADRQKLSRQVPMTYEDFERLSYILDTLKFIRLEMEFWETFQSQFEEELKVEGEPFDIEVEVMRYTGWLVEFCNSAPDAGIKRLLKGIFALDGDI